MRMPEASNQNLSLRNAAEIDLAIGQMLALAERANVSFHIQDGRLAMVSTRLDPKLWAPVRWYLDEIGLEAITDYFRRTTDEDRAVLSAAA